MKATDVQQSTLASILIGNPGNKRTLGWQQALQAQGQPQALEVSYARLLHAIRAGETLPEVLDSMYKRSQYSVAVQNTANSMMSSQNVGSLTMPSPHIGSDDIRSQHVRSDSMSSSSPSMLTDDISACAMPSGSVWAANQPMMIRLDAPGENAAVERGLIALGAADNEHWQDDSLLPIAVPTRHERIAYTAARQLQGSYGRIWYPAQWFRGYCRLLSWLHQQVEQYVPQAWWLNAPSEIALMFDKRACSLHLHAAGIAVPSILSSTANQHTPIHSYAELRQQMEAQHVHRVFVKLFCGSAASGVIAYQYNPRTGAEIAMTTIGKERIHGETIFYNSGRLIRYTDAADIGQLVDWIAGEGMQVERWISKAALDGQVYDVRQLVCRNAAGHAVMRLSRTPITNLHLRNKRLLLDDAELPETLRHSISDTAQRALASFPGSFCAGMDVLVPANGRVPLIMDVNPFGDLLYHVQQDGMGTYEWELAHFLKQWRKEMTDVD
ncbi:STM4014 family protein [Paenibacillus wenxiniae]|uniref:STM4014 family protein n=1 Tax=Paenibacillus wenxiniae TaxID=1636843 RepID=A0ABW4RJF1_9BACL